jgi:hypothetical protein
MEITRMARKTTFGTRTQLTASVADLGSVVRSNLLKDNTFAFSFVLDETLQLEETPITENPIHLPPPSLFSDAFKVFHHNLVSIEIGNNVFAYVVVTPSHKPSLFSRDFLEQSKCFYLNEVKSPIPPITKVMGILGQIL